VQHRPEAGHADHHRLDEGIRRIGLEQRLAARRGGVPTVALLEEAESQQVARELRHEGHGGAAALEFVLQCLHESGGGQAVEGLAQHHPHRVDAALEGLEPTVLPGELPDRQGRSDRGRLLPPPGGSAGTWPALMVSAFS
jgi:hypothetical protein